PRSCEFVGRYDRTNDVVTPVDQGGGKVADAVQAIENLVLGEEQVVDEVVRLEPGERQHRAVTCHGRNVDRIVPQGRAGAFISTPSARCGQVHGRIFADEAAVVRLQDVQPLVGSDRREE